MRFLRANLTAEERTSLQEVLKNPDRKTYFRDLDKWLAGVLLAKEIPVASLRAWAICSNYLLMIMPECVEFFTEETNDEDAGQSYAGFETGEGNG